MKTKVAVTQRRKVRSSSLTPYPHQKWHGTLKDNPEFGPAPVWNVPPPSLTLLPAFMPQNQSGANNLQIDRVPCNSRADRVAREPQGLRGSYDPRGENADCDPQSQPGANDSLSHRVPYDPRAERVAREPRSLHVSYDSRGENADCDPQSQPGANDSPSHCVPYDSRAERVAREPKSLNVSHDPRGKSAAYDPQNQPRASYDSLELVPFDLRSERVAFDRQCQPGAKNSSEQVPYNPQSERVAYDPQSKCVPHDPQNQLVAYDPPPPVPNATRSPPPEFLYHYTDHTGMCSIVEESYIRKSCPAQTNRGGWYGEGVYLTAVPPSAPDNVILINNWNDDGLNTPNSVWNGSKAARLQYCFVISSETLTPSALEKIWDNKGRNIWVYRSGINLEGKVVALRRRW